jgi:hypothetical protein
MHRLTADDTRELRQFGVTLAAFIGLAFWLVVPWLKESVRPLWPLVVGGALAATALAWPRSILPVHRVLLPVLRVVGAINTWLLLGALYFGILLPVGWVLRRLGRLQYVTRFDPSAESYRIEVAKDHRVRLEEPF